VKAVVDTICLFLLASMAAAFVTAALIFGFSEQPHVQANQGFDRAGEVGR
jgi:hypothetical protein